MPDITEKINRYMEIAEKTYRLPRYLIVAIVLFPLLIDFIMLFFLRVDVTRSATRWMLNENHPVELLTFLFLMMAVVWALALARQEKLNQEKAWVYGFYILFAAGVFLVGMEEISWGQQFLKFHTFGIFKGVNQQGEVNIHNIGKLHGNSAYFRFVFGFGGLVGVWLYSRNILRKIAPSPLLLTWFLVITFFAVLGIYKNLSGDTRLYYYFLLRPLSEMNEMLIGLAAFLFVWLNMRRLSSDDAVNL